MARVRQQSDAGQSKGGKACGGPRSLEHRSKRLWFSFACCVVAIAGWILSIVRTSGDYLTFTMKGFELVISVPPKLVYKAAPPIHLSRAPSTLRAPNIIA